MSADFELGAAGPDDEEEVDRPDAPKEEDEEDSPEDLDFCELCGCSEDDDEELLRCEECGRLNCANCREYDEDGTPYCADCFESLGRE